MSLDQADQYSGKQEASGFRIKGSKLSVDSHVGNWPSTGRRGASVLVK